MPPEPSPTLLPLRDWTVLEVSGADAADFLHGQFTNDLQALPENQAQLSAYCVPKGAVIADFLLWQAGAQKYRIALPTELADAVQQRLQMFKLRSEAEIVSLADTWRLFGATGEISDAIALPDAALEKTETGPYTAIAWPGGRRRWLIACPLDAAEALQAAAPDADLWRLWDIEDGLAFVRAPTREQFLPQHLNLDLTGAISFTKGCYPGQEVVARMKYRGKTKYRAYLLAGDCDPAPQPGDPIHLRDEPEARPCGHVVDARTPADSHACRMLASVRAADAARALCAQRPDGPPLEQLPLPYALPEGD